jgi:hypothetical protein
MALNLGVPHKVSILLTVDAIVSLYRRTLLNVIR